jgi:DNA polymerase-3 subunit epsilon
VLGSPFVSDGAQPFALLIESAREPKVRIEAWGSPYEAKDLLKARGYQWDARQKVWIWNGNLRDAAAEAQWAESNAFCRPRVTHIDPLRRFL